MLWDYCAERRVIIHNLIPRHLFQLQGATLIEAIFGIQGDISKVSQFGWYNWCYFIEKASIQLPYLREQLGRVLGPSRNEGKVMAQAILKSNRECVTRRTARPLTGEEWVKESEMQKRNAFDAAIQKKFGDSMTIVTVAQSEVEDEDLNPIEFMREPDDTDAETFAEDSIDDDGNVAAETLSDVMLNAELQLMSGDKAMNAKVINRSKDKHGNYIGDYDENILIKSLIYDVQLDDGSI